MGRDSFWNNEQGQGMVETALIIALIALVAIAGLRFFGEALNECYERINEEMPDAPA